MRRIMTGLLAIGVFVIPLGSAQTSHACSDIFINHPTVHIEARTMDFGTNMA